jgi:hypothetical protein
MGISPVNVSARHKGFVQKIFSATAIAFSRLAGYEGKKQFTDSESGENLSLPHTHSIRHNIELIEEHSTI